MKISDTELNQATFSPKKTKLDPNFEEIEAREVGNLEVCRKRNYVDNDMVKSRYYALKNSGGHLYNPSDMYRELRGMDKYKGLNEYKMSEVNKEVYVSYNRFLDTKNEVHLSTAERGLI